jgi:hypothetical protein
MHLPSPCLRRAWRAQTREAAGAGECAEEQPVRLQRPPDQRQRARQVVDAVERTGRDDEVEGGIGKGQPILIRLNAARRFGEAPSGIRRDDLDPPLAQEPAEMPSGAAEIERRSERPAYVVEPADQFVGGKPMEIIGIARPPRRAVPPQTPQAPVERPLDLALDRPLDLMGDEPGCC